MNKLSAKLWLTALFFFSLCLFPASAQAAEQASAKQITVDNTNQTATLKFTDFSSAAYQYSIRSTNGKVVIPEMETSAGENGQKILTVNLPALQSGYYYFDITAPDTDTELLAGFYLGNKIKQLTYEDGILSWTDTIKDTTGYEINFYENEAAALENPSKTVWDTKMTKETHLDLSKAPGTGSYYITITPYTVFPEITCYAQSLSTTLAFLSAPENVRAVADYKSVTVSWNPVEGAASYEITNQTTGTVLTTKDNSVLFSNLEEGIRYTFSVVAKMTDSTISSKAKSASVSSVGTVVSSTSVETTAKVLATVSENVKKESLELYADEGYLCLKWEGVTGADGYNIYSKMNGALDYTLLGSTKAETFQTTISSGNSEITFLIKPYTTINNKNYDNAVSGTTISGIPSDIMKTMKKVRTMTYYCKTKRTVSLYRSWTSKKAVKTLKKGVTVDLTGRQAKYKRSKILYKGKTYYLTTGYLQAYACNYTTSHYSEPQKLNYVKNYSSKTNYLIWISHYTQQVNIFQGSKGNWTLINTFICSTGNYNSRSPHGVFYINQKEEAWKYATQYELWITHYCGRNSFHTRIHDYNGGYKDATIGKPASNGCVRLYDEDAEYIYKNMPIGTKVISY